METRGGRRRGIGLYEAAMANNRLVILQIRKVQNANKVRTLSMEHLSTCLN